MPKFKVTGFASIIVQTEVTIEAATSREALAKSRGVLANRGALRNAIIPNSQDEAAVHDYEPGEASIID